MTQDQILKQFANLLTGASTNKLAIKLAWSNAIEYAKLKCRQGTIDYYTKTYLPMQEYFDNINLVYIEDLTKQILNNMITMFKSKGLNNNTINKYIEVIKMIAKFNFDNEYTTINNISNFKKLPKIKNDIKIVSIDNEIKILEYMNNLNLEKGFNLRNVLFMYLFKETGVRLNELLNIETKNININNNELVLTFTKTKEKRTLFFSDYTKSLLIKYLPTINDNQYLFSDSTNNASMKKRSVYDFLNIIKDKLNINQSITPHKWRHTLATRLLDKSVDLESIRLVLGHTSLNTTQKYLHADLNKIKKDLSKVF